MRGLAILLALLTALAHPALAQATFTAMHSFTGRDGAYPDAGLLAGPDGALFGATTGGGLPGQPSGGVAFRLTPLGHGWTETVLHRFGASLADGGNPRAMLVSDPHGALYGTTALGGPDNFGTVFRLTPPAVTGGEWTETILYRFTGDSAGAYPAAGVTRDASGCLYGTTSYGGPAGQGAAYRLCPTGSGQSAWTLRVLHEFGGLDGGQPEASLLSRTVDGVFTLFGATSAGGASGWGTVFSLAAPATPDGAWTYTVLRAFSGGADGAAPVAGLWADGALTLYGTTTRGGLTRADSGAMGGVVFKLTRPAAGQTVWKELVLHSFAGGADGAYPLGGVVEADNGHLFGTTAGEGYGGCKTQCGTVFELAPRNPGGTIGPWNERVLHGFAGSDGDLPSAGLIAVTSPKNIVSFIGMTERGGASGVGAMFMVTP